MAQSFFQKIQFFLLEWDRLVIPPFWLILEAIGVAAAVHALLNKRDPRAALGWMAVCLLFPGFGVLFYLLFGINRIETRAKRWGLRGRWDPMNPARRPDPSPLENKPSIPFEHETFQALNEISKKVTQFPLRAGCRVQPLHNGERAYPEMLAAIAGARKYIYFSTYIFETNPIGCRFIEALGAAARRGVDVRVLVDGAGTKYSRPRIQKLLKEHGIRHALFLPFSLAPRSIHLNLRTHRKILVVDGKVGFTGGMNIGGRHMVEDPGNKNPTVDIHFKVEGPVLGQLLEAFFMDWYFATEEVPQAKPEVDSDSVGAAFCRGVISGPNEDFEKLSWIINGAFTCAKERIRIMTPYFIPDSSMITTLNTAALRGVKIEIILPQKNNLPFVDWASRAFLVELLEYDVMIYFRPPPFAHSKMLVVDDFFSLIGSANLDPRSLRLNFEFNLEVYDRTLAQELVRHFEEVKAVSHLLSLEEYQKRSFPIQLRDAAAKIFSPYL